MWCIATETGLAGWVPKQYLSIDGALGTVVKGYSSAEMAVELGDELTVEYYLNGWGWCTDDSGKQGWVPEECMG